MSSYLDKDSEEDDGDNGGKEHLSHGEMVALQQKAEGESDGASQATVRDDKLIFGGQFDDAELVYDVSQTNNTCDKHVREGLFVNRVKKVTGLQLYVYIQPLHLCIEIGHFWCIKY